RSLVETGISVLKRTYGDAVSSRVGWRQFRELVVMCLVYNVERAVKLGVTLLDWLLSRLLYSLQRRISTEPIVTNWTLTVIGRTDSAGRLNSLEILRNVFLEFRRGVQKRKLNGEHTPASNEAVAIQVNVTQEPAKATVNDIESIEVALGCAAAASSASAADAALQQQAPVFLVRLIKDDGPKGFKVTTSGGRTTITSHHSGATAGTLWPMEVASREYKLKVGQTVRLAELKEKTAELYYEKLYSPVVRFNTKPEVAEAKVILVQGPQGEPFGEIEFTAKEKGETTIGIDYEFYSHISTEYMGLARILVKVTVE
ncbi:MAG: hypothetical protein K6T71_02440, partial [Candidatus Bipolaricaulota bacterium]|nr:hypothetical protein [Candidatus Bipolaricaulota bacterium]